MLVSIVIPCYNSEKTIGMVADQCMECFSQWDGYECEMILVNDHSRDQTYAAILKCQERYPGKITAVNFAKNFGQHAAILAGMHYVHGDLVVGMDDDLQNKPEQIRQFLDKMQEGYDVVFGIYRKRNFNFIKNFFGKLSQFLLFHLVDRPKGVEMSSFWCARAYVVEEVRKYQGNDAFVQLLFARTTDNMADITVEHYAREYGHSNYTFRKGLKLFMTFMDYSSIPLRVSNILGILFSIAGFIATIVVIVRKLLDPTIQTGWSSLMCLLLIVAGMLFLMLGIMGEYIGKLVNTSTGKPQYVIREVREMDTACREESSASVQEKPVSDDAKAGDRA
ncbi:MAG: glycosyltransferase family 2 protein [Lachnospiraceae bacterium]|nr:glycosyltransferase family 2 protein [Lachnospiraceae bacterium]